MTGKGKKRLQAKGAQTRRLILEAAIARFGREGYRATAVADIARDAAVGGTVPFNYFPNKESLFLAALDEDAAAVIDEGVTSVLAERSIEDWRTMLIYTLVAAVERRPLARRVLSGLEPDMTDRMIEIPALAELRKACAERLRLEQILGTIRNDIDPVVISNGVVAIVLSLLMSLLQLGTSAAAAYGDDVAAVLEAAMARVPRGRVADAD